MKRGSTLFLKAVVYFLGAIVLALCVFALPVGLRGDATGYYRPIILGMYVSAVPFFFALHQAIRLLSYIDKNQAFSELSSKALHNIKYCAVAICALFAAGLPYIYVVADKDDAPGAMAAGLIIIFASGVIATAAGVLQTLVQHAVDIKSENDLTV